jgi:hypothetical protein
MARTGKLSMVEVAKEKRPAVLRDGGGALSPRIGDWHKIVGLPVSAGR